MSNHTRALLPLESWAYNSPDLRVSERSVDVGLLAEALIYYETLLVNVTNQSQFAELLRWFVERRLLDEFLALVQDSTIIFYDYSFLTTAILDNGNYVIWNIQYPVQAQPNTFERRFLYHPEVQSVLQNLRRRKKFYETFRGRIIEAKADNFGPAIENARSDFADSRRNALILQAFVDELYRFRGLGRPPEVASNVVQAPNSAGQIISWNINFEELAQLAGKSLNFHGGTPLTAGALCNRLLLSAAYEQCDLYLGRPMSSLVGDKLYETVNTPLQLGATIEQLKTEVEFPNVRKYVNNGDLTFKEVLSIRNKAGKFRNWLQEEANRDRNAIIAYHHEVTQESGLTRAGRTTLSILSVTGGGAVGSVIGSAVAGPVGAAIGGAAGGGLTYLMDLASKIGEEWRPVVFGNWMQERVQRFLKQRKR